MITALAPSGRKFLGGWGWEGGAQSFSGLALQCINWKMGNNGKASLLLVFGRETGY